MLEIFENSVEERSLKTKKKLNQKHYRNFIYSQNQLSKNKLHGWIFSKVSINFLLTVYEEFVTYL